MDESVKSRFETFLMTSVTTNKPSDANDIAVNLMVMQEYIRFANPGKIDSSTVEKKYKEIIDWIYNGGDNSGL